MTNEHLELLKEVLNRANKDEIEQYYGIFNRKVEISKRMEQISFEDKVLDERDSLIIYPEKEDSTYHAPDRSHDEIMGMSSGDLHDWSQQIIKETAEYNKNLQRYNEALEVWGAKNKVIMNDRLKLTKEFLELKKELDNLKENEKWLLLKVAIRSQPNLLTFIQKDNNQVKS